MRRVAAVGGWALSAWLMTMSAHGAEGRVADPPAPAPDASRSSHYEGRRADREPRTVARGELHASKRIPATREKRGAITQSSHSSGFYIFDAGRELRIDRDGDEYFSEFRIRFDADTTFGDALVYAKLYLRRIGEPDWLLYHVTDAFRIFGQSPDDDYFVTTTLGDGWPTSQYDVLIDLYEVGFDGIVATFSSHDTGALSLLPLEEAGLDAPIEIPGYAIREVITTLLIDEDADGYYSRFRVEFDPDADYDGRYVYAVLWVRPQGGEWIQEYVSDDFLVDSSGTADVFSITADWISGYPTALYDLHIDLYDAASDLLAASAGSERPELSRAPLEDQSRDARPNPPTHGGQPGDSVSRERGGGALALGWALALLSLCAVQRWRAAAFSCSRAPARMPGSA